MASYRPIPAPPRTPTPPPDEEQHEAGGLGIDGTISSPNHFIFDRYALSPRDENFPPGRYGSVPLSAIPSSNPLSPADTNSLYSPMSIDSAGNLSTPSMDDGKGPFNFQPTFLTKSPITKSVGIVIFRHSKFCTDWLLRALAKEEVINTSIAAFPINSS